MATTAASLREAAFGRKASMGRFTRISGGFFLVLLCLAITGGGTPATSQGGSYGSTTRAAIEQIIQANDQIVSGKPVDAQNLLRGIAEPLKTLEGLAQKFREVANREHDRCQQRIGDLEIKTSDLYTQQLELNNKIADLDAQLAAVATRRNLAETEITRLSASIGASERSMREREARLEELRKWWWVPGYGQYLAIRTLVDNDIGQYQRAVSALGDQQRQLQQHTASVTGVQALREELNSEKGQAEKLNRQLNGMRSSAQNELRELKGTAVFLTDADVFWGKAETLLQVDAKGFIGTMSILQDVLESEVQAPSFTNPDLSHEVVRDFRQKLVEFAESVDANNNFLLQDATAFCGGPPRVTDANATVSARCDISKVAKYYKIVDPKKCAFQFLNPPHCPPKPKSVNVSADALAAGKARGTWSKTTDQDWQNWIGKARCASAAAIYYGKTSNAQECENKCLADPECTIWAYNALYKGSGNEAWVDSKHECWGGSSSLTATKAPPVWGGFISGGIR
jgi:predicted  nucleic acid-binding Zn-ribbon protein